MTTSVRIVAYTCCIGACFGASAFFGWGYDVNPKMLLKILSVLTIVAYVSYAYAIAAISKADKNGKNHKHMAALWAVTLMQYIKIGWLVTIYSHLREYCNKNYHIST